jgi:hypothetical protein
MKREQYIPFDKEFLLELQISSVTTQEADGYRRLFDILEHYFHYEAFNLIRTLKHNYSAFDPDITKKERADFIGKSNLSEFKESLHTVLERGNYSQVEQHVLDAAFEESDLIGLQLAIDFNDFKDYGLYTRGLKKAKESVKKFYFWKREIEFDYYERVLIYLKYNDAAYFKRKKMDLDKLPFTPDCIVLKIFKNVPKNDLETIFPNAVPKMSTIDKLLLWVPGIAGGISLLSAKVIPALVGMYKVYKSGVLMNLSIHKTALTQGLLALGILGGYLFRQYSNFVNKKIKFSKMLSDSLYFKNLGNNSGAFYSLLNSSEEEELKETILAYTFLQKSKQALTADELDNQIETWFKTTFNTDLDFDVEDALGKLKNIGLGIETDGKWNVISLDQALIRIDEIWDNIFDYNQK